MHAGNHVSDPRRPDREHRSVFQMLEFLWTCLCYHLFTLGMFFLPLRVDFQLFVEVQCVWNLDFRGSYNITFLYYFSVALFKKMTGKPIATEDFYRSSYQNFHTVNHNILLVKSKSLGVSSLAISDYLIFTLLS